MSWGETLYLKNFIEGKKTFVGGTSAIAPAYVNSKYYNFTPKLDGIISIKGEVYNSSSGSQNLTIAVQENGSGILTKTISLNPSGNAEGFTFDVPIKKSKTYKISLGSNSWITIYGIYFCGQITDYNYFETAVIE